jgi:hypothetical protein
VVAMRHASLAKRLAQGRGTTPNPLL